MGENNKSKLTRSVFCMLALALLVFWATMMVACIDTESSNYQKEATMRNEINAYVKAFIDSRAEGSQLDVTHLVEKYIKIGDSYETAKEVLLKNGFSVYEYSVEEAAKRKDVRITYQMEGYYEVGRGWFHKENIRIFLGKSPQSEKVDWILGVVNFISV